MADVAPCNPVAFWTEGIYVGIIVLVVGKLAYEMSSEFGVLMFPRRSPYQEKRSMCLSINPGSFVRSQKVSFA